MKLRPFFSYYGSKFRAAPKYPTPEHDQIIEPFAGSAGYALNYPNRRVLLVDKDPVIAGLWKFLIKAKATEILSIPLLTTGQTTDDLHGIAQEAKHLVGFWLNAAGATPCRSPGAWMRSGKYPNGHWGAALRSRIASQVEQIRHWECWHGSYDSSPVTTATWFVDPPYQLAGKHYRCGSKDLEYGPLAAWCRSRIGQTIVCENTGASWLPFVHLADTVSNPSKHGKGKSPEAIWTRTALPAATEKEVA